MNIKTTQPPVILSAVPPREAILPNVILSAVPVHRDEVEARGGFAKSLRIANPVQKPAPSGQGRSLPAWFDFAPLRCAALTMTVFLLLLLSLNVDALAQFNEEHGSNRWTQWGIMDGNRVRTLYSNHGEIARWPDQPSGEWPKGSGHSYVDGVAFIVSAKTRDSQGRLIYPMSTNYREFIDRDPVTLVPWGFAPLVGYSNPRQSSPARSDDESTWPSEWPDRPIDWAGQWNGWFGKGVKNADLETLFVFDDAEDREWIQAPHEFYPCPGDQTRGGLGLQVKARGFQWNHPLAQDVIFWLYEIENECEVDYEDVYFAQYIDWGIGGTDDSGDDEGAYNKELDLAFAWDFDGIGSPGLWGPVGTAGYAFLESPGNSTDGIDNDDDGITDESRTSGPGQLITGQDNIRAYVEANYDMEKFERFYLDLELRPAYQMGYWWTGDEDMDWRTYSDLNGNGQWDPGEPLNDDVGRDGLGPNHPNYPGRDEGEGDGIPTEGEPNFDGLDKDESDQIGLTGFAVFDVHTYQLINDEENYRVFSKALPPIDDILLEGGRNLGMFFSSGPFPLKAGQTERFSMALIFAEKDFNDPRQMMNSSLARKKQTVQQIYNADYQFAQPPNKSNLTIIPGDGMVTLFWDDLAEKSYDPFLGEFDFEGYMIYRSTEPNFEENLVITDSYGSTIYQKPLAQFDLINGIRGLHPVTVNGVQFNLGNDTGLRHSYIDRDVINGRTYYYALVPYDRGFVEKDGDGNFVTDVNGQVRGISPSATSAIIKNDIAGNISVDVNTGVAVPRAPAAGYIAPEVVVVERDRIGTGTIGVDVLAPTAVQGEKEYVLTFRNDSIWQTEINPVATLTTPDEEEPLFEESLRGGKIQIPFIDGFAVDIVGPTAVTIDNNSIALTGDGGNFIPQVLPASSSALFASRFIPHPADFEIEFTSGIADTSMRVAFGMQEIPVPFRITNQTTGERARFALIEDVDSLKNGAYDHGEMIVILMGTEPGLEPVFAGGNWRASWSVRLYEPDPVLDPGVVPVPPTPGSSSLVFRTHKPFQSADEFRFSIRGAEFDSQVARSSLDNIIVVPNPYVASSNFEPSNTYRSGRGERRIYFMNLPPSCTIRIYTITGELVKTLQHESGIDDGQTSWDLTTKDGMNLAFGVYLYHVEAKGVGEHRGKFAVIK
ncbi:MAG: hypothetical protein ACNA8K_01310 [Cyclonatronaceae bacterium]